MKIFSVAVMAMGLSVLAGGQAMATAACQSETPAGTFAPIYTCLNGTMTNPGTFVGTVGWGEGEVNQIGSLLLYNGGGAGAYLTASITSSIYQFSWAGGLLDIVGRVGNNGTIPNGVDMELFSYIGGTAALIPGASLYFPQHPPAGTPNFNPQTLYNGFLAAGNYLIDTYAAPGPNAEGDPGFQINFAAGTATAVPEPVTMSVFGGGLIGAIALRRRRKSRKA